MEVREEQQEQGGILPASFLLSFLGIHFWCLFIQNAAAGVCLLRDVSPIPPHPWSSITMHQGKEHCKEHQGKEHCWSRGGWSSGESSTAARGCESSGKLKRIRESCNCRDAD